MGFWGWVTAIAAGWVAASILFAVAWKLAGSRIFRKQPAEQQEEDAAQVQYLATYRRGER